MVWLTFIRIQAILVLKWGVIRNSRGSLWYTPGLGLIHGIPSLGRLLFLIFINDLPLTFKNAEPSIFADDTGFTASTDSIPSLLGILDEIIESLNRNWMISNKLTLNTLKTQFLVTASATKVKEVTETLCVHVQDEPICRLPYAKILGFYIDQKLNWEDRVAHIVKHAVLAFQLFGVPGALYQRMHYLQVCNVLFISLTVISVKDSPGSLWSFREFTLEKVTLLTQ